MNLWNTPGIPHKGWAVVDIIDLRDDDSLDPTGGYETCEMCGTAGIRFVHVVEHSDWPHSLRVGCICAEKMCEGYKGSWRESELRSRAERRRRWANRSWEWSKKGSLYLIVDRHFLVIIQDKCQSGKYKYSINGIFYKESFDSAASAKSAIFDKLWPK